MTFLAYIADQVINRPLMVTPEKLTVIAHVLDGRIGIDASRLELGPRAGDGFEAFDGQAEASRFVGSNVETGDNGRRTGVLPYMRTANGVAILTIVGTLVNRGAFVGAPSGLTSYEGIKFQIDRIAADPKVKSVVLDLDSPGGAVSGCFETVAAIRALDAKKPVIAVVNGMACSAAYALASGARRIVSTPTGISGSIGVVMLHVDYSGALDKAGIKPTFLYAGAHKIDGNPYEPLSKGAKGDLQKEIDTYYGMLVDAVASGRRNLSTANIRATEARPFIGAAAKAMGLVDDIGTFEDVITGKLFSSSYFAAGAPAAHSAAGLGLPDDLSSASPSLSPPFGGETNAAPETGDTLIAAVQRHFADARVQMPPILSEKGPAPWSDIVEKLNTGAFGMKTQTHLPAPNQPGAASWSDIADTVNGETFGMKTRKHLAAPKQPGAVSWSDIADELNAELAATKPTQAGAASVEAVVAQINAEGAGQRRFR